MGDTLGPGTSIPTTVSTGDYVIVAIVAFVVWMVICACLILAWGYLKYVRMEAWQRSKRIQTGMEQYYAAHPNKRPRWGNYKKK